MSSSTSSSEVTPVRRGRALRIVLMLLVALILLEGITREKLVPASKDLSRFQTYRRTRPQLGSRARAAHRTHRQFDDRARGARWTC